MNGIIVINKEKGVTSRKVVNEISQHLGLKKVGHTGTLDPLATGVLVICVGKATKIVELLTNNDKEYIATVVLGLHSDTLDITGEILNQEKCFKTKEEIEEILITMIGTYDQEVPIYSAIKIKGKKLYQYARNNEQISLPKRKVTIKELSLIGDVNYINETVTFKIKCLVSKGTYIRSLIRDIANKLNTIGLMSELVRTKHGPFLIEDSLLLSEFKKDFKIKTILEVLSEYPQAIVSEELQKRIQTGQKLVNTYQKDEILFVNKKGDALALYRKDNDNKLRPWKMFI